MHPDQAQIGGSTEHRGGERAQPSASCHREINLPLALGVPARPEAPGGNLRGTTPQNKSMAAIAGRWPPRSLKSLIVNRLRSAAGWGGGVVVHSGGCPRVGT
jgi:hypothetical protein